MSEIDLGGDDGPERLLCASARAPPPARPCEAARALARSKRPEAPKEKRIPRHERLPQARSHASAGQQLRVCAAGTSIIAESSDRGPELRRLARCINGNAACVRLMLRHAWRRPEGGQSRRILASKRHFGIRMLESGECECGNQTLKSSALLVYLGAGSALKSTWAPSP